MRQLAPSLWQLMNLACTDYMMLRLMIGFIGVLRADHWNVSNRQICARSSANKQTWTVVSYLIILRKLYRVINAENTGCELADILTSWCSYIFSIIFPTVLNLVIHSIRVYIQFSHVMGISVSFLWKQFLLNKLKYRIGHYIIPWPWLEPRGLYHPSKWPPPVSARNK